jgi:NADPH:quinone reductase-like Zn-dependent oxidoreductase
MRALVTDPSAAPPLALAEVPEPEPAAGELLVRMEAASVNRGEVRRARGGEPGRVLGWDVAGTVAAVGEGVGGFTVGERVVGLSQRGGSFAELVAVPAAWAAPLPDACDAVRAATLPVAGLTAVGILRLGRVHAGDRVLLTGAAGGVGLLAVQLAVEADAKVTGQAAGEERAAAVRAAGAEPLLHPGDGSPFPGEYDVALDGIGGPALSPVLAATVPQGRVVLFGNSADAASSLRVEELYNKALTVRGFYLFLSVTPDDAVRDLAGLAERVAAGRLRTRVQAQAPLAEALPLIRDLYERRVTGKVVLTGG